jgi:ArsR family transcriptional regulator, arsenate/arsenite/antimonite-responsive transcriptional repressor
LSISTTIDNVRHVTRPVDPDVRLLAALADPARLDIVRELAGSNEVCACDLTDCCGVSQPTVSHHLRVLREAGVVVSERRGSFVWYRIAPNLLERLSAIATTLVPGGLVPVQSLVAARQAARPSSAIPPGSAVAGTQGRTIA